MHFPTADEIYALRNHLICSLVSLNISPAEIMRLNLPCVLRGSVVRIDASDGASFITLTGTAKERLNGWQMLRPRGNPKGEALFISLRGKSAGQRLTVKSIRAIIKTTAKAKEQKEQRKSKFSVIDGGKYELAKKAL